MTPGIPPRVWALHLRLFKFTKFQVASRALAKVISQHFHGAWDQKIILSSSPGAKRNGAAVKLGLCTLSISFISNQPFGRSQKLQLRWLLGMMSVENQKRGEHLH